MAVGVLNVWGLREGRDGSALLFSLHTYSGRMKWDGGLGCVEQWEAGFGGASEVLLSPESVLFWPRLTST